MCIPINLSTLLLLLPACSMRAVVSTASCGSFRSNNPTTDAFPLRIEAEDFCDSFGVTVETTIDTDGDENLGWIDENDWMAYDVYIPTEGLYGASYRLSNPNGRGALQLEMYGTANGDENGVLQSLPYFPSTSGDWQSWVTVERISKEDAFNLQKGWQTIAIKALEGDFNLNWFELYRLDDDATALIPPPESCRFELDISIFQIEAEDFCTNSGVELERTTDSGGEWDVTALDSGDYMTYQISLPDAATRLKISYRISSPEGRGGLAIEFYDEIAIDKSETSTFNLPRAIRAAIGSMPKTSDWQGWTTVSHTLILTSAGDYLVYLRVLEEGWKLNWLQFEKETLSVPTAPIFVPIPAPAPIPAAPTNAPVRAPTTTPTKNPIAPTPPCIPNGFVRTRGTSIVDANGENLILRGMGFGGWMLQEPYMMLVTDSASAQHDIFANIRDVVGQSNFNTYHKAWLDNYCTQEDVKELKASGFDSLRAPLHYNLFTLPIEQEPVRGTDTWLSEGFERLDRLLQWCKEEQVYLILDLHAAPGGQGRDGAINDFDDSKPSLWEDSENVRKTVSLWTELAKRYRDETWIAAYDLLNEPNWNFEPGHPNGCTDTKNAPLKSFYDQAIAAIRQIDPNHMIIIEGNCWCNNHNGLWPMNDDNVVLSFHRYWIENTVYSIQKFLDWRDQYNVPLWMGESGENHNQWYREAVNLLESQNIGWAWWPWKKMESTSSSFSIRQPDGYQSLVEYWAGRGSKPDSTSAFNTMMQLASNALLVNTVRNVDVVTALTGHARSCDQYEPVALDTTGAVRIEAENYCNMFGISSEDTFDDGGGFNVGWIDAGDWVAFNINVPFSGSYTVEYRVASPTGDGGLQLETSYGDGTILGSINSLPATNDWQSWTTVSHSVSLSTDTQIVKIVATEAGWNLNWVQFSPGSVTQFSDDDGDPDVSGIQGDDEDNGSSSRRPLVVGLLVPLMLAAIMLVVVWRVGKARILNAKKTTATITSIPPHEQGPMEEYSESGSPVGFEINFTG